MMRTFIACAALALAGVPVAAFAQDGAKLDCVATTATPGFKTSVGQVMTGAGDEASRNALFAQFGAIVDGCVTKHKIDEAQRATYFDYSLARISREWLIAELARSSLKASVVDKALDFGPRGANPDLSGDMTDDQISAIVAAYVADGVNIDAVDQAVWEKVGAYAASTSIYWNRRKLLAP